MMANQIKTVTGAVLAGGKSTRMGTDKAFVRLRRQTLIEACLSVLSRCFTRNIIIANQPDAFVKLGPPVFPDELVGCGPMGGIHSALRHASTEAVFVVACDMPFLDAGLIRAMAMAGEGFDGVVARLEERFEPLHALYQKRALPVIELQIAAGEYSLQKLVPRLNMKVIGETELAQFGKWQRCFRNVNTPEELAKARESNPRSRKHVTALDKIALTARKSPPGCPD